MLTYLRVSDFALVRDVEVEFLPGLNVLTGETGAGKTVLIGALGMLLGGRGDTTQIRSSVSEASFSCTFDLDASPETRSVLIEQGFLQEGETELFLTRTLAAGGKGRCTVNGALAPVSTLATIGDALVDVHGQNEHQALLRPATHLDYLDRFAGAAHQRVVEAYREVYGALKRMEREKGAIEGTSGDPAKEAALLAHEMDEIDHAKPTVGALEELEEEVGRLKNSRELAVLASRAADSIDSDERPPSSVDGLREALAALRKMTDLDPGCAPLRDRAEALLFELEDLASEERAYLQRLETEPARLEELEERLNALRDLQRRFGGSIEEVLAYRESAAGRLAEIEESDSRLAALEEEEGRARQECERLARKLSKGRKGAADELSALVEGQMAELELKDCTFSVRVEAAGEGRGFGPNGADSVEFMFSPVRGEEPRPLRRIASGGEMSRVMLALKIVLAGADRLPVLVFDEIDAGIGGVTASKVGEKLYQLTRHHQVFCVTHQPQIASMADLQCRVFKVAGDSGTGIEILDEAERVAEICRMMGDSEGRKVTEDHARDILERSLKARKALARAREVRV